MKTFIVLTLTLSAFFAQAKPVVREAYCEFYGDLEVVYPDNTVQSYTAIVMEGRATTTLEARNQLAFVCSRQLNEKCLSGDWDEYGYNCYRAIYGTLRLKGTAGSGIAADKEDAAAKNRAFCRTLSRSNRVSCETR